jgi:hypothetical protein
MPSIPFEAELRQWARERIASGALPCGRPSFLRVGGGPGDQLCAVCDCLIGARDLEYEVKLRGRQLYFHLDCREIWELECGRATTPGALSENA